MVDLNYMPLIIRKAQFTFREYLMIQNHKWAYFTVIDKKVCKT